MEKKGSFFDNPSKFSFKDTLAILFFGFFFYYAYEAIVSVQALELIKALIPLAGIILGGYFMAEGSSTIANAWMYRSQGMSPQTSYNIGTLGCPTQTEVNTVQTTVSSISTPTI